MISPSNLPVAHPRSLISKLNCAWRDARDHGASRAFTIVMYVTIGLTQEAAVELFDFQWARYQENRANPEAGDLELTGYVPFLN